MRIHGVGVVVILCLVCTACNEKDWERPVEVAGVGETTTIDRSDVYNLTISGLDNTVTVGEGNEINNLTITGYNNLLTIGRDTTVKRFSVTGADNTVYVPAGSGITFDDSGSGNQLIEQ